MLRYLIVCLIGLFVGMSAADAQSRRQIDATPFAHAPCSVLDGRPCTPSFCSVFNDGPCIPEIDYPYGQNLQLTIESVPPQDQAAKYRKPDHDLDTIGDLFAALRSCWSPPPSDIARRGHADVGSLQLQALRRDHRHAARDVCHGRRPGGHPRHLSEGDQCLAAGLHAPEIHRWTWAARWPGGRSPSAMSTIATSAGRPAKP